MAAERAINLLNMGFPSWPALFVLAMNPAEVPAAHRASGVPAAQRNDERPSGSTSHQVCSIA